MKKFLAAILAATLAACATTQSLPHRDPTLSWDQSNLKLTDHGCPSAVFVAPKGELVECQLALSSAPDDVAHSVIPGYPTIEEAAAAGLKAIVLKPSANWYEWGGIIVRTTSGYLALPAVTSFSAQHVQIGEQRGEVADYHTHVCNQRFVHDFFSPADLAGTIFFHRTAFMGDLCTGLIHRFKAGEKPDAVQISMGDGTGGPFISAGRIIGKFTTPYPSN